MYFLLSDKEEILEYNSAVAAVFDNKKSVIKGKKFEEIIHPQYIQKVGNNFNKSISSGKMTEIEVKLKVPSKKELDVRLLFSPFISGKAKQVLVIGKDITIEKRKEIDLLRFYYVAQNTVNPLQITDINGKMIYVNPAFEMASGFSQDELLGQNPSIFSSKRHSQKFWDKMWETISAGKVWVGDVENKKKNGDTFYTQLLISPILDNNKNVIGYFGIHRDLTEKRNLEKQLIHTQKMESIGTLAAGIAHEVGNPLASISALVQIVQRSTEDIFINDKLELVKINRISKIIRDLVDFSRPSNYELKSIDINENLMEAIEIVRVGKKAKNIVFI
jgi:PAS domain S-box-containing protein